MTTLLDRLQVSDDVSCDSHCQELKKRSKLKESMQQHKQKIAQYKKQFKETEKQYYQRIHGTDWERNRNTQQENSDLRTKFDEQLRKYNEEFQLLIKYYIDSAFLLKNQKKVIKKNKTFSNKHQDKVSDQKDAMSELNIRISTANRNIEFSMEDKRRAQKQLAIAKYTFYGMVGITTLMILYTLFLRWKKVSVPRPNTNKLNFRKTLSSKINYLKTTS